MSFSTHIRQTKNAPALPTQGRKNSRLATNEPYNRNQYGSLNIKTIDPKNTTVRSRYIVSSSGQLINQNMHSVLSVIFILKISKEMITCREERNIPNYQTDTDRFAF